MTHANRQPKGSPMANAMRRRAGIADEASRASTAPAPPSSTEDPSVWQRVVDWFHAPPGDRSADAGKAVDQAVHDQVLPQPLQIKEALEAQAKKKAMIDAMLRGAE